MWQSSSFTGVQPLSSTMAMTLRDTIRANGPEPKRLRILVVDDNADAADIVSALLEFAGHQTATAANGLEAIRRAQAQHYDVVVLDLGMPIMDGFEAAVVLGKMRPAPVLIALSAWDDAAVRQRTTNLGFAAHLRKPAPFEILRTTLAEVTAHDRR
jgi:CheY-like chemotaxis protein